MEATTGLHAADEVADGKNEGELPVTFCILGQMRIIRLRPIISPNTVAKRYRKGFCLVIIEGVQMGLSPDLLPSCARESWAHLVASIGDNFHSK